MAQRISGESIWTVVAVIIVVAVMLTVIALLVYFGPDALFGIFQGIMSMIALYMISQLHAILR